MTANSSPKPFRPSGGQNASNDKTAHVPAPEYRGQKNNSSKSGGVADIFSDSASIVWHVTTRPKLWVPLSITVFCFFLVVIGLSNLALKTFFGETVSLPATTDGFVTGASKIPRYAIGATQEQVSKGAQPSTVNSYNQPLQTPEVEKEIVQPNVP